MSFWPFSSSYGNNNQLLKFLDSIVDFSAVTVDNLLDDRTLQQEFSEELKNLAEKSSHKTSLPFVRELASENSAKSISNAVSDSISVSSSGNDSNSGNSLSKNAREQKLLELLLQPHILNGFLDYIVASVDFFHDLANRNEAEEEVDEGKGSLANAELKEAKLRRCIQCAADVLSSDMWVISNRIIETPVLMGKLWLILSLPKLLENSPSVAYLVQILDHLMETNSIELLNFIRRQESLVDTFLAKVEIPILMDFFLKIIQTDKGDSPTGLLEVLSKQGLIPKLIDILKPVPSQFDETATFIPDHNLLFRQTAATEFIKALVAISSNATLAVDLDTNIGPNQLTRELALRKIITSMLNDIILVRDPINLRTNKHGIANCVAILIELIRKNNSDYDLNCGTYGNQNNNSDGTGEVNIQVMFYWLKDFDQNPPGPRDPIYLGDLLEIFSEHLEELVGLISAEPEMGSDKLGMTRFKISELVAELLHCSNMILLNSRKVAYIVRIRDKVRDLKESSLLLALSENIIDGSDMDLASESGETEIFDVTSGLDDVSLYEAPSEGGRKSPLLKEMMNMKLDGKKFKELLEYVEYEDSDDDEPAVSSENPFVCSERDAMFRADPCVGDLFKIRLIDLLMLRLTVSKFTLYPWHNFFHNVVFDLIQQIFNGKLNSYNSFLIVELFRADRCNITSMIVDAFRSQTEPRPGYMGHLILVSEEVVKFTSLYKPALISPIIVDAVGSKDWEWFVDDVLLKTRELYNVILGADPEYADERSDREENQGKDEDKFGFDSSTVGFMDMEPYEGGTNKETIILGDSSNHDEFIKEGSDGDGDKLSSQMPKVSVENMSPKNAFGNSDMLFEDFEGDKFTEFQDNEFLDNLLGSSSSDEEDDDSHQLRRVPKHYS